ncbi:MAG: hypothetical protein AB1502_16610, partial [Thermodesulfobacteriota bacterium]
MVKIKFKSLSGKISSLLLRIVSSSESSFAFFIALLALTFAYRIQLTIGLFANPVRPFDFNPRQLPIGLMLWYLPYDVALVLLCFLLSWLLSRMQFFIKPIRTVPVFKITGFVFLHLVLILLLLIHGIHGRLLFDVQTGFDTSVIMEAVSGVSFSEIIKLVEIKDYLFLFLPIGIFWWVWM